MADDEEETSGWVGFSARDLEAESTPIYDGGVGYPPGGMARSHGQKAKHPPISCPYPRMASSLRGFYRCPACGAKVRLGGTRTGAELGYELADRIMPYIADALGQCWYIAWSSVVYLAKWVIYLFLKLYDPTIGRIFSKRAVMEGNGGVGPEQVGELVVMLAAASMITAKYRGSRPELTVTSAKDAEGIGR